MEPIVFLVLMGIVMFVLQNVFKNPEDNKQQPGQGQRRPGGPAAGQRPHPARPRRSSTDLDRFLEETRKKKKEDESKPIVLAEVASEPQSLSDTAEREQKADRLRKAAAARASEAQAQAQPSRHRGERKPTRPQQPPPSEPRRPPLREQAVPVLLELAPTLPLTPPAPTRSTAPPAHPPPPAPPAPPPSLPLDLGRQGRGPSPGAASPSLGSRTTPPVLTELLQLLRKPRGAALAIVLHEILESPAHRRRG
jgi:hypothetical protein